MVHGAHWAPRPRREAEDLQYKPRYPLVEDSPFRYQATLESPPAVPVKPVVVRQPEPPMRTPSTRGLQVATFAAAVEARRAVVRIKLEMNPGPKKS